MGNRVRESLEVAHGIDGEEDELCLSLPEMGQGGGGERKCPWVIGGALNQP